MDDKILSAAECNLCTENVCINASQIYDSCRAKECIENLRVYFTRENQETIDSATKITAEKAEVIWIFSDVETLPFHKGYYTVNLKFFFKVELNAYTGLSRPVTIEGLAFYEKKVVLFGSTGEAKIFQSKYKEDSFDIATWKKTNMPNAVAEVVDPLVLDTLVLSDQTLPGCECDITHLPQCVHRLFDNSLIVPDCGKSVYVTLGLFLLVRLEREVQISVPASSFCIPDSDCHDEDIPSPTSPCDMFRELCFPMDEFFPPRQAEKNCRTEEETVCQTETD